MMVDKLKRFDVLGVRISAINMDDACLAIENSIKQKTKSYICTCPVSTIIECRRSEKVLTSVNSANLATPDGMPIVWLGKLSGHGNIGRVYGPDLLLEVCNISEKKGYQNYFYGSSIQVLEKLQQRLKKSFPDLIISGAYSPPYRELSSEEDEEVVRIINSSKTDILWIGLGSPKQDLWMYEHRDRLNVPVIIGIGAAFDFISGMKKQAPRWMQEMGLEWLFRLINEPKRLWKRYVLANSFFIYLIFKEFITGEYFTKLKIEGGSDNEG